MAPPFLSFVQHHATPYLPIYYQSINQSIVINCYQLLPHPADMLGRLPLWPLMGTQLPKQALNVMESEVECLFKLVQDNIVPLSFEVPHKVLTPPLSFFL
jgi:hypothetical protein